MPRIKVQQFRLHKADSTPRQCQDAIGVGADRLRFCVADGATESFDAGRWARLLCKQWVCSRHPVLRPERVAHWLAAQSQRFTAYWRDRTLPWYGEEKARGGAFATFLGLTFNNDLNGVSWQAIAIGDSCLIHLTANGLFSSFPIQDPAGFNFHPVLLPSSHGAQAAAIEQIELRDGRADSGDVFLLVTDAMAAWYLNALLTNPEAAGAFESALSRGDATELESYIAAWRVDGSLRNDDIAAIWIEIEPEPEVNR